MDSPAGSPLLHHQDKAALEVSPNGTRTHVNGLSDEQADEAFDVAGFLKLLEDVMRREETGLVSARIHVVDGVPWAASVQFESKEEKAA